MRSPSVEIHYCTQCKFLLRASWLAQELLTSFEQELAELTLVPSSGGILEIRLDGQPIFSNKVEDRFPDAKEIKRLVRDHVAPGRVIGHG